MTETDRERDQTQRIPEMNERLDTQPLKEEMDMISSEALLNGRSEIQIQHEGEIYRLRRTSKGKLIMTK